MLQNRQLVALARALARGSKILILDEATGMSPRSAKASCLEPNVSSRLPFSIASVDHATDALVQDAIRNLSDVTLLIVAHRLTTIGDSDKILVLDSGRGVEFDTPKVLLQNKQGYYHKLCNDSHEKEELYALAEGATRS